MTFQPYEKQHMGATQASTDTLFAAEELIACFVVLDDPDFTLIAANAEFYRLLGCPPEDLRSKYGDRFGALLDATSLKLFADHTRMAATEGKAVQATLHIKQQGADAWIHTRIRAVDSPSGRAYSGIAYDVSPYEQEKRSQFQRQEAMRLTVEQAGLDCVVYDAATAQARSEGPLVVLPRDLFNKEGMCPDFENRLAESMPDAESQKLFRAAFRAVLQSPEKIVREVGLRGNEQAPLWSRISLIPMLQEQEQGRFTVVTLENITSQKEATRSYLNETQFFQAMLSEKDAYGQVDVTADCIIRVGGMWNLYNEIIGQVTYTHLITQFINKVVHPEDRKHYLEIMQCENFIQSLNNGIDRLGCEFRRIVDQNKLMWMQLSVNLLRDPLTKHVLALLTIKNINDKKQQEILLLRDSRLDQLTNTYNKMSAESQIREYLGQMGSQEQCAMVVLDVDNFKHINDTQGHRVGDQVLTKLAAMLSHTFRKNDIIGRFGGDEFIILLKNVDGAQRVIERLDALYTNLGVADELGTLSCSAGVAITEGRVPYEVLFYRADTALYQAKAKGKSRFVLYEKSESAENLPAMAHVPLQRQDDAPVLLMGEVSPKEEGTVSFEAFIGDHGDIAYLIDPATFDLICGNKAFFDRIGMAEAQCTGMKCYEAMHRRETPCPFCSKANWSTDKFYMWRNLNLALEQEFLIKNKLVNWRGKEALLALAVDISNDKSIVDSLDNGATEVNSILSGVQRMTEATSLTEAMPCALEAIGSFFRADAVCLWQRGPDTNYIKTYQWNRKATQDASTTGSHEISAWIESQKWEQPVMMESPEAMLCYSYEMYDYMKSNNIRNQRWVAVNEGEALLGCISIDNSSSNFQNIAFLESFTVFIASELKKRNLVEEALYADHHDDLTDLLSRKSFEDFMTAFQPDQIACLGVLVANFNNLKGINGSCGFQTGNYFIRQFADMLRHSFADQLKFRINGDEFLVIAQELTRTQMDEKIIELEKQLKENGGFGVSLGAAWDDVENDLAVLIEQATQAMRVNKKRHYDSATTLGGAERHRMLSDLMDALAKRQYQVFLQPKVELLHGAVVGAEALIRYYDKDRGIVPPAQFIDMLEKNNLIRYIDLFVFEEVCKQLEEWKRLDLFVPVVSVNFSRLTLLERDILASMEAIIAKHDVSRKSIEIEITESVVSMDKSVLHQTACDLYKAGFSISLDDFGTKYTNFAILSELDFSVLKIDKSLVDKLGSRTTDKLIMKNIIYMCKDLSIVVIAEGIENKLQEHILQDLKCQMGQGYLYGKPMPIEEFTRKYLQTAQRQ